ncbi:HNH endonuclease [Acidovorax sp. Root70]|uniref:HNH endonuclease n=1 Tax=Acidovorax sp. Root70 TaxID=1736590 RepID=UPI0006F8D15D|nr:HNH endonuclease [Acidovorax sp. Root70]KRB33366.1 hypothetical protein ASD94_21935 [Acidovorax sp. Root70]
MRDIAGQQFGQLIAAHVAGRDSTGKVTWMCVCACGNQKAVTMLNLTSGNTKSCGCARRVSRKRKDLSGQRFGLLTAIKTDGHKHWECVCDCGVVARVMTVHLVREHTRSCGCLRINPSPSAAALKRRERNALTGWVKGAIADAGGVCDCCGSSEQLHAHHIMPFATHPAMRADPDNSAALCAPCHREVHRLIASGLTGGDALYELLSAGKAQHYRQKLAEIDAQEGRRHG